MSPTQKPVPTVAPVTVPEGVSLAEWALERNNAQNPRIRAYLGSIRLLEGAMESNYSILHCSPDRLLEILGALVEISDILETQLRPLLRLPSKIPRLEEALRRAQSALDELSEETLSELQRLEEEGDARDLVEVREVLCLSIGRMHGFLQETFGELMAADPRSQHDADYFISKRFPEDIEEAEQLYEAVIALARYLRRIDEKREQILQPLITQVLQESSIPSGKRWEDAAAFLDSLATVLTPKLKEVLALRGIRFYEMERIDRYSVEIPCRCRMVFAFQQAGRSALERVQAIAGEDPAVRKQSVLDLLAFHAVVAERMERELREVDHQLQDLVDYMPLWLDQIGSRRALLLQGP